MPSRVGQLYVTRRGQGEPVLLLHGISSNADAFRYQLEELADRYQLVAWDAPGYARSADPPYPLTMNDYADAAKEVLDALSIARAHVVGASWGGVIVTRLALRHPQHVRSLTLIDSTPGREADPAVAKELRLRSDQIADTGVVAYARARAPRVLSQNAPVALVSEVEEMIISSVRLPGYKYAAEALAATDHRADLSKINASSLVLVGEHDKVTGLEESRLLALNIPESHLVIVPGAGHLANQEQPKAVNAELQSHWSEIP